jgi:hypothetical protein
MFSVCAAYHHCSNYPPANTGKRRNHYLIRDGSADQFSADDKKLMTRKFKEILLSEKNQTFPRQKTMLNDQIQAWKGAMEQTDDILVIGFRM